MLPRKRPWTHRFSPTSQKSNSWTVKKPRQLRLLDPRPRHDKTPKLRRPLAGFPICLQMLRKRVVVDGKSVALPSQQCQHRGRVYEVNGLFRMTLCVCCARRLMKRTNCTLREWKGADNSAVVTRGPHGRFRSMRASIGSEQRASECGPDTDRDSGAVREGAGL
jgi:hypothetical protein